METLLEGLTFQCTEFFRLFDLPDKVNLLKMKEKGEIKHMVVGAEMLPVSKRRHVKTVGRRDTRVLMTTTHQYKVPYQIFLVPKRRSIHYR